MRNISDTEFENKYNLYKTTIYSIAYNYVHNQSDSDDITQEVFLKYLKSNEKFESLDHEKYWLIRVTINTSISFIKSKWKSKVIFDNEYIDTIKDEQSANSEAYDKLHMREVIAKLDNKYKDVIILYYYQNYSTNEIASILNISNSAVKKRLERARNIIRKEY